MKGNIKDLHNNGITHNNTTNRPNNNNSNIQILFKKKTGENDQ